VALISFEHYVRISNRSVKMKKNLIDQTMLPDELIISKIYLIRGKKVMLDRDLAYLYKVETKQLKRAVRRNRERFPDDFMFEMSKEELANWRYQFGTSSSENLGLRIAPFAFTEHGLLMLASVLNSADPRTAKPQVEAQRRPRFGGDCMTEQPHPPHFTPFSLLVFLLPTAYRLPPLNKLYP
jgi:hypothetical protein